MNCSRTVLAGLAKRVVERQLRVLGSAVSGGGRRWMQSQPMTSEKPGQQSFEDLGLDSRVAAALRSVHNVHSPTAMQTDLLKHLSLGEASVVVRQGTGTGKTFALASSILSLTLKEHQALLAFGCTMVEALEAQTLTTLVVVPNRELALQIEAWITGLLGAAYPKVPVRRVVQRFVSGEEYEGRQKRVLKRHGVPAIVVGTPRCLRGLLEEKLLVVRAPRVLQKLLDTEEGALVSKLREMAKSPSAGSPGCVEEMRGLRRVVVDEVDQLLKLPGKFASEKQKKLRREHPRPGHLLLDEVLLQACGLGRIKAAVDREIEGVKARAAGHEVKGAKTWATGHEVKGTKTRAADREIGGVKTRAADREIGGVKTRAADREIGGDARVKEELRGLRRLGAAAAGRQAVQVVALSATANSSARWWMYSRWWMADQPRFIDNVGASASMPAQTAHYCLVIEDGESIRNLRAKAAADGMRAEAMEAPGGADRWWEAGTKQRTGSQQLSMMQLMAEVAANSIDALGSAAAAAEGPVIVFTRSDASSAQFAHELGRVGIKARDIMAYFGGPSGRAPGTVYIATEEAARGLDIKCADLVLILDIPKSAAGYAHMAGRTGRFGRPGSVVCVVPVGRFGWYESKMRGIFATLGIEPTIAPFVEQ